MRGCDVVWCCWMGWTALRTSSNLCWTFYGVRAQFLGHLTSPPAILSYMLEPVIGKDL